MCSTTKVLSSVYCDFVFEQVIHWSCSYTRCWRCSPPRLSSSFQTLALYQSPPSPWFYNTQLMVTIHVWCEDSSNQLIQSTQHHLQQHQSVAVLVFPKQTSRAAGQEFQHTGSQRFNDWKVKHLDHTKDTLLFCS